MPESFDPKVILAILGTGVFSLIGIALWLWKYKRDQREDAVQDRESEQLTSDQERNRVANEDFQESLKEIPAEIPDTVDPNDPWDGVR